MSMAKAIAEYTAGKKIGARTLFATHYHELNVMTNTYPQIKNYRVTVEESNVGLGLFANSTKLSFY